VNGKYSLTALGEVVYNSLGLIENGLDIYWKLKTIDALKANRGTNIPRAVTIRVIILNGNKEEAHFSFRDISGRAC
jgi:hypothetical protein